MAAPAASWAQQTVHIEGTAEDLCTLGVPEAGPGQQTNFDTPSGAVFSITQLADPSSLTTLAANITLLLDATCNSVHRVVLTSDNNGLWRQGVSATTAGFGSAVPFQANLSWAEQHYTLNADATVRQPMEESVLIGRPASGQMQIEFQINAGATNAGTGTPLLAGEYSDVLRVTVEPQ